MRRLVSILVIFSLLFVATSVVACDEDDNSSQDSFVLFNFEIPLLSNWVSQRDVPTEKPFHLYWR